MFKANHYARQRSLRLEHLESRQYLAGDTFLINFQHDEATIPTRYVRDTGQLFGDRGNGLTYGWSSDHTDQVRERSVEADQRLDTLVHVEAGQKWEIELENGKYEVTVVVGDPGNNDGIHTVEVEGVSYWNAVADTDVALSARHEVTVSDGRLTMDAGAAADKATRINYIHIVGLSDGVNDAPSPPIITEPAVDGQVVNPADVHMEAVGYSDPDGDSHKSSDWEIWTVGTQAEPVWMTLGIEGVERLHTHLGDGVFMNAQAGEIELAANTDYELRVRFRDDAGSVSEYASRLFQTGASSTIFPRQLDDIAESPAPDWRTVLGAPVDLPIGPGILSPGDDIIAIDFDYSTGSVSPGGEFAANILDGNSGSKYLNFGKTNTGFIVTPSSPVAVQSFQITTANDFENRDPDSYLLYGTNDPIVTEEHGHGRDENWTLISSGALNLPALRETTSAPVGFSNATSYSSYKMIFPTVKDPDGANSMQIADVSFFTNLNGVGPNVLQPGNFIVPIRDADGTPSSDYPGNEGPANAIDNNPGTKYLNYGEERSGFIVTPSSGASTVTSFRITTANDAPERDPTSWALYGTNEAIASENNGLGDGENWTFIDSGTLDLPLDRQVAGADVPVDNTAGSFTSYRIVFPTVRDSMFADSMQIAEIQFFGDQGGVETPPTLRIEDGASGSPLLQIDGTEDPGNAVTDFPSLGAHANLRVVITAGSNSLVLNQTDLVLTDKNGQEISIFLPAVNLAPGGRLDLWVSSAGATYFGSPDETTPNFTNLAREANLNVPFITTQPGFVIEEVGNDYRLPVNIAFVPNPGPNPNDPLYYVSELYGSIQVVTRDGTKHEFATGLLDYNPTGPISGSGEQGLTGIAVERDELDPDVYHLYVGMLWDNDSPPGGPVHYPKVERIDSVAGGLEMDTRTVLLNMQPETQGQSHQISNISIGPDGKLYVHNGDGFDASTAQDLDQFRGKILRINKDGSVPEDNPFYDDGDGITARDYIYAYGFRNPFGGAWRASDGKHYEVENGPSVDRIAQVNEGVNYEWDGSNASMFTHAIYNWNPSTAPVNLAFIQPETFNGSQFPAGKMDHVFISESGPTYANGPQANGKRISEMVLDEDGELIDGPETLIEYVGDGRSTVVGLAAGPDGLYFTELYEDSGASGPTGAGARIYRIRYVNPIQGDYDIDGDVDKDDYAVWKETYGSNLLLAADGNGNGMVDLGDFTVWRDALTASSPAIASQASASSASIPTTTIETTASDSAVVAPTFQLSTLSISAFDAPGGTLAAFSTSSQTGETVRDYTSTSDVTYRALELEALLESRPAPIETHAQDEAITAMSDEDESVAPFAAAIDELLAMGV